MEKHALSVADLVAERLAPGAEERHKPSPATIRLTLPCGPYIQYMFSTIICWGQTRYDRKIHLQGLAWPHSNAITRIVYSLLLGSELTLACIMSIL